MLSKSTILIGKHSICSRRTRGPIGPVARAGDLPIQVSGYILHTPLLATYPQAQFIVFPGVPNARPDGGTSRRIDRGRRQVRNILARQ